MKQLSSLHKLAIEVLLPAPDMDYIQKGRALRLLPLDKQLLFNECVLMRKVVHGKAPRRHVHGNKQLLPTARIDTF